MAAVTGFNDRDAINLCLVYRYIISYEPYMFKGSPEDLSLTHIFRGLGRLWIYLDSRGKSG